VSASRGKESGATTIDGKKKKSQTSGLGPERYRNVLDLFLLEKKGGGDNGVGGGEGEIQYTRERNYVFGPESWKAKRFGGNFSKR